MVTIGGFAAVEHHRGVAQRAEGHRDGHAADHVVDDLVPGQDAQRIGADVVADREADDRLAVRQVDLGDGLELRLVDRRNAVLARAAGEA